ncbi:sphingolipid C4-monooxygenase [Malassezia sp. CBS 17886]|nr:sphingolipid C4-monooxygenase [Malassezia sp. CBS 17886]
MLSEREVQRVAAQSYAAYYTDAPRAWACMSDKHLSLAVPVAVYWLTSLSFHLLDVLRFSFTEQYRIHPPEQIAKRNKVGMWRVVLMVVIQHVFQTLLGLVILDDTPNDGERRLDTDPVAGTVWLHLWLRAGVALLGPVSRRLDMHLVKAAVALYWWGIPWLQFWLACFFMDAWQYCMHRLMHEVRWMYRALHSHHHRLYVPYAFGALYNHPLEGLLLDTLGAAIGQFGSGLSLREASLFFALSTYKTVCDHCGYAFPWYIQPLHLVFPNCAEYHDVHHQIQGLRYNYSQPFFVHFDTVLGTRMDPEEFERMLAGKRAKAAHKATLVGGDDAARLCMVEKEGAAEAGLPREADAAELVHATAQDASADARAAPRARSRVAHGRVLANGWDEGDAADGGAATADGAPPDGAPPDTAPPTPPPPSSTITSTYNFGLLFTALLVLPVMAYTLYAPRNEMA